MWFLFPQMIIDISKTFTLESFSYVIYYLSQVPEDFTSTLFPARCRQIRRLEDFFQAFIENFTHALIPTSSPRKLPVSMPFLFLHHDPRVQLDLQDSLQHFLFWRSQSSVYANYGKLLSSLEQHHRSEQRYTEKKWKYLIKNHLQLHYTLQSTW